MMWTGYYRNGFVALKNSLTNFPIKKEKKIQLYVEKVIHKKIHEAAKLITQSQDENKFLSSADAAYIQRKTMVILTLWGRWNC